MKLKTLLLSSGAVFMVAGGAQAADLSIAEPVEYVLVCAAFGDGYWYIPGTQTCIKIGGEVKFKVNLHEIQEVDGGDEENPSHSSHWDFVTEGSVNFTAKSMTDHGALVGYVKLKGVFNNTATGDNKAPAYVDEAWLSLGHVTLGHLGSVQNVDKAYAPGAWVPDNAVDQVRLEWAAAGFGLYLGIEDPRDRWGTDLPQVYSMPDITGAVVVTQDHWNAKVTAGWAELAIGSVHGVAGAIEATMDPLSVAVGGAFGTGMPFIGAPGNFVNGTQAWNAYISGKWQATSTVSLRATFAYAAQGANTATSGGAKLVWAPYAGFEAGVEGSAWKYSTATAHTWSANVYAKRFW